MKIEELKEKYPKFDQNKIKDRRTRIFSLIKRPDACYYYRILTPHRQLVRQYGWESRFIPIDPLPHHTKMGIPTTVDPVDTEKSFKNLLKCHSENLEWADIVVMQRPTCDHHLELMRYIQKTLKKPVVYEADDNYIDVPKHNPGHEYFTPRAQYIKDMITEADLLTATTEYCVDVYRKLRKTRPSAVCPNSIDMQMLDEMPETMLEYEVKDRRKYFVAMKNLNTKPEQSKKYLEYMRPDIIRALEQKKISPTDEVIQQVIDQGVDVRFQIPDEIYNSETDGKTMIMWGGSPTHKMDLATVEGAMREVLTSKPELILGMVGFMNAEWLDWINRDNLYLFGLVPVKYYYSLYKQLNAQIGIAPVNRDKFNYAKSNLKVIEYMALNIYAIATDYVTYEGCGPNVPLCKTEEEWTKALNDAVNDEEMRFEITQKNREFVEQNYDIAENVKHWKEAYESLL